MMCVMMSAPRTQELSPEYRALWTRTVDRSDDGTIEIVATMNLHELRAKVEKKSPVTFDDVAVSPQSHRT